MGGVGDHAENKKVLIQSAENIKMIKLKYVPSGSSWSGRGGRCELRVKVQLHKRFKVGVCAVC